MIIKPLDEPRMLYHALNYARRGLPVFPVHTPLSCACSCGNPECSSIGKHPRTIKGLHAATTNPKKIREWWSMWPDTNIGINAENLIVIDVDADKGGHLLLEKLETEFGKLPDTRIADTGGGGNHFIYRRNGHKAKNGTALRPGIDVKTDGGFIVASPSLHVSGKRYKWAAESARELADFPVAWLPLLNGGNESKDKPRFDTTGALAGVSEGERDNTCWRLACKLRNADVPMAEALELVLKAAANCTHRFPEKAAREKVERAYRTYKPAEEAPPHSAEEYSRKEPVPNPFTPQPYWQQYDVANIQTWECKALEPIIEGILAKDNLCWLAAETQTGKTLFMLWICLHLLHKGSLFDKFAITPVSRILYVACEDPARRFKARLQDMEPIQIEAGHFVVYVAPGFSIADLLCSQYFEALIQDGGFDFVVIDTFQAATMGVSSFDDEKLSVVIRRLLDITRKLGTTIVVNDHFRKTQANKKRTDLDLNEVKGSGGKLQNADVFLLMDRQGGKLRVSGKSKEWDKPIGFLLDIAPQGSTGEKFTWAGDLQEFANDMAAIGEANRQMVLDSIPMDREISSKELTTTITTMQERTVKNHLARLVKDGRVLTNGRSGKGIRYRKVDSCMQGTLPIRLARMLARIAER